MADDFTVFVVDDDVQACKSVCALVSSMGLKARGFASAEEFLAEYREGQRGCLVADVRMLGMSGLELQQAVVRRGIPLPVIILTAYPKTPVVVKAMQAGAITLLDKPYRDDELWDAIRKARTEEAVGYAEHERRREAQARLASLTPEEHAVMEMIVAGKPNKTIARELGVSLRTVESRRHQVFTKMQVDSVAGLVKRVIEAGVERS